jgi:hypothetical protein
MNLSEMLVMYRAHANPAMQVVASEFLAMNASEQRELLFWLVVDTATNPTQRASNGQPRPS